MHRWTEAELAHDRRAEVQADAHPQRLAELGGELAVELGERRACAAGGCERGSGGLGRALLEAEERHDPVAHDLVDAATGALDRPTHGHHEAVEDEYRVVG